MPLGDLEDEAMAKVLIVAQDQILIENLRRELPVERQFKVGVAASGFEAGIQAESFHPDCIIVDFSIGRVEALQICQKIAEERRLRRNDSDRLATRRRQDRCRSTARRSTKRSKSRWDAKLLAERLRTLIGSRKELV